MDTIFLEVLVHFVVVFSLYSLVNDQYT